MREERILLTLAESVHFVDEDHRRLSGCRHGALRLIDRIANVLDAPEYGGNGNEGQIKGIRHQPRNRGFADAGRPPENHGVRTAVFKSHAQRRSRPEELLLSNHLIERMRTKPLRKRLQHGLHRLARNSC